MAVLHFGSQEWLCFFFQCRAEPSCLVACKRLQGSVASCWDGSRQLGLVGVIGIAWSWLGFWFEQGQEMSHKS